MRGRLVPAVLCYHRVLPAANAKTQEMPAYSVTPQQFSEQMALLREEGFTSVSLDEYCAAARGERELPERAVLVTFDDGYADNYLEALPVAQRFGVKLNLFICTGLVAGERPKAFSSFSAVEQHSLELFPQHWQPLSRRQLKEMAAAGVGFGFHSHTHQNLCTLSAAELDADASLGMEVFQQYLGRPARIFAFPYGHFGSYSQRALEILRDHGIEMFFSTELGRTPLEEGGEIFSRIVIHPEDDLESFRRKLFGGYDWVGRIRRLGYATRAALRPTHGRLSKA